MSGDSLQYIQLYPTFRCNQQCAFCFNTATRNTGDMTREAALRLLEILAAQGIAEMDIMGGEPFLLDWMPDFMAAAIRKGVRVNISTNGSRPDIMQRLRGMDPASVTVGVSLEGSTAKAHNKLTRADHFDKALQSIRSLVSLGLDPIVKTVVNRTTLPDLENIVALVTDLGVRRYCLIHMDVMTKDPQLLDDALSYPDFLKCWQKICGGTDRVAIFRVNASCFNKEVLPSGVRCAGGVLKLAVMPDGSVYPCNLFQSCEEFRLGNIFVEDLAALRMRPVLSLFKTFHGNQCRTVDCENQAACTGGCPAHGYLHRGDAGAVDIRCIVTGEQGVS